MCSFSDYDFAPACQMIKSAGDILIAGHVSPDGDTLGSTLGLSLGLQRLGKRPRVVFQDDVPGYLQFLPGVDAILKPAAVDFTPQLVILVDCAALHRTGDGWVEKYLPQTPLLILDHHALRDDIPAVSIIDGKLAATAELIYWLLQALEVPMELDIARCLYTALCTDTGGFRFTNTRTHTFEIAAKLKAQGINLEEMRIQLFESRRLMNVKLMGHAMANICQSEDKKLVWSMIDTKIKKLWGAADSDTEGIAGQMMLVEGVKVGVFLDERVDADGNYVVIVSFRGRDGYNVGKLAAQFGGGGHYAASGCTIPGSLDEVWPCVIEAALLLVSETEVKTEGNL